MGEDYNGEKHLFFSIFMEMAATSNELRDLKLQSEMEKKAIKNESKEKALYVCIQTRPVSS